MMQCVSAEILNQLHPALPRHSVAFVLRPGPAGQKFADPLWRSFGCPGVKGTLTGDDYRCFSGIVDDRDPVEIVPRLQQILLCRSPASDDLVFRDVVASFPDASSYPGNIDRVMGRADKKCCGGVSKCFRLFDDGRPRPPGVGAFKPEAALIAQVMADRLVNDLARLLLQGRVVRVAQAVGDGVRVVERLRQAAPRRACPSRLACAIGTDDDGQDRLLDGRRACRHLSRLTGVRVMGPCGGCSTMYLRSLDR